MNEPGTTSPPSSPRKANRLVLAVCAVLGVSGFGVAWAWWSGHLTWKREPDTQRSALDPRLTYPTPYRNVHPDVKYVGDQACAACHQDQCANLRQHPMGQALAPVAEATPLERYVPEAFNPFAASGLEYGVLRRDGRSFHRERSVQADGKTLIEAEAEVQFAVGSGARARSYIANHDGYLFQSPITWYPHGGRWDLSPSYEKRNQHFSRPVAPGCLFCHCNQAEHMPDTVNRYREPIFQGYAIGCERCHGPGELHVRRRAQEDVTGFDDTIVNPGRLEHSLREAVCQQCHLQAEQRVVRRSGTDFDYRPGLPLHLFLMDFVDGRKRHEDTKFVGAVEQMVASRCYRESREPKKLGCTSCHDPHRVPVPAEKVAHYRGRCLQCHTEASCSVALDVRQEKNQDSCIACHMPRNRTEVNHTASTDHRVPRRAPAGTPVAPALRPTPGPSDLVPFHRDLMDPLDEELPRNLGLALMAMMDRGPPDAVARQYAEKALPLLEGALARDPHDTPAGEAKGDALRLLGSGGEALAAYEAVLAERPESESTLHRAGDLALELNRAEAARSYFERVIQANPWRWPYHHGLAVACFRRGEWNQAVRACRDALKLDPANTGTRSLLIQCHLGAGEKEKADAEFETLEQLLPEARRGGLRSWYDEQQRRLGP